MIQVHRRSLTHRQSSTEKRDSHYHSTAPRVLKLPSLYMLPPWGHCPLLIIPTHRPWMLCSKLQVTTLLLLPPVTMTLTGAVVLLFRCQWSPYAVCGFPRDRWPVVTREVLTILSHFGISRSHWEVFYSFPNSETRDRGRTWIPGTVCVCEPLLDDLWVFFWLPSGFLSAVTYRSLGSFYLRYLLFFGAILAKVCT